MKITGLTTTATSFKASFTLPVTPNNNFASTISEIYSVLQTSSLTSFTVLGFLTDAESKEGEITGASASAKSNQTMFGTFTYKWNN